MIGKPADQSSSGARESCSGMVSVFSDGNGRPVNSLTSRSFISLYDAWGVSSLSACARRNRSDVLVSCWAIIKNPRLNCCRFTGIPYTGKGQVYNRAQNACPIEINVESSKLPYAMPESILSTET